MYRNAQDPTACRPRRAPGIGSVYGRFPKLTGAAPKGLRHERVSALRITLFAAALALLAIALPLPVYALSLGAFGLVHVLA